jgi:transcriptional regulator with XRE-family HTH domain
VREARLQHDLSQSTASAAAGVSPSTWSRLERGFAGVTIVDMARALSVVGLDFHVRAYPGGRSIRDVAQTRLLERLRVRLGPGLVWATEVPLPGPGERRAWDALIRADLVRIGVEAETRVRDGQDLERRLALKRRDGGVDHVLLLLADTRHHRHFLSAEGGSLRRAFDLEGREAMRRLAVGRDPGGSAIVLL